jgi:hypothetical protein
MGWSGYNEALFLYILAAGTGMENAKHSYHVGAHENGPAAAHGNGSARRGVLVFFPGRRQRVGWAVDENPLALPRQPEAASVGQGVL